VRTIRLVVEYDGTTLCGWQRQANGPTVQQHLEEALASLLQGTTPVTGASRTDAGVHARGQVAVFTTDKPIPLDGIRRGLNSLLPDAIAVVEAAEAPADFHPRFSATGKHYRYCVLARPDRSPRWATRAWHRPAPLDLAAFAAGAAHLVGEHDFAAFRAAGCSAKTTVRRVDSIELSRLADDADVIAVDVRGNAFLRHMVRIVVGTLVDVAEGRLAPGQVAEILASRDRTRGGQTAPPHGLELVRVSYEGRRPVSSDAHTAF
jgi:tRNA pseudouridine38-40 synthase